MMSDFLIGWGIRQASFKLFLALPLLLVGMAAAQTDSSLDGTVLDDSGNPIAGVSILGGKIQDCCPVEYDHTTTNERGQFHLKRPGAVIRLFPDKFEPLTVVVQPGTSQLKITLLPLGNDLNAPPCGPKKSGTKRIGGSVGFDVPRRNVRISGGKPDVDYVVYTIKPKTGNSYLEFWFGPYAISTDPDDEEFLDSVSFSQRRIVQSATEVVGIDTWGQKKSGGRWRQTVVVGAGGAKYRADSVKDAELFDGILDSICLLPLPK